MLSNSPKPDRDSKFKAREIDNVHSFNFLTLQKKTIKDKRNNSSLKEGKKKGFKLDNINEDDTIEKLKAKYLSNDFNDNYNDNLLSKDRNDITPKGNKLSLNQFSNTTSGRPFYKTSSFFGKNKSMSANASGRLYRREAEQSMRNLVAYKEYKNNQMKVNLTNRGKQYNDSRRKLFLCKPENISLKIRALENKYLNLLSNRHNPYSAFWEKKVLKLAYHSNLQIKNFYNGLPQYVAPSINGFDSRFYLSTLKRAQSCRNLESNLNKRKREENKKIPFSFIYKYFNKK